MSAIPTQPKVASLLIQLPGSVPGKSVEDGSNAWVPAIHLGGKHGILGAWLWPGPTLPVKAVCGVSQQMEDLSFCLSLLHYHSAFQ